MRCLPSLRASLGGAAAAALFALPPLACHTIFDGELHGPIGCAVEGAYGTPHCPEAHTCVAGVCAQVGAPLGQACEEDQDCRAPARCLDPATVHAEGSPRCSRPCCASTDCGPAGDGQVCWSPPEGAGSFCWPGSELGRGALGERGGGESCASGSDCRSGLCDGRCMDLCCDGTFCGDEICRVFQREELGEEETWSCGNPAAPSEPIPCEYHYACPTGWCVEVPGDVGFCAQPCCSSSDCGSHAIMGVEYLLGCAPIGGTLRACSALVPTDALPLGAACSKDAQCRSAFCLDGYCSDACCTDASCGDESRFSCEPVEDGGTWALRCVRK